MIKIKTPKRLKNSSILTKCRLCFAQDSKLKNRGM